MNSLEIFSSQIDTTGAGEVRIGDTVVPRDLALAYAVRLIDAAGVAARELSPAHAIEIEMAREAMEHLNWMFKRPDAVLCRIDGETGQRRLPVARLDERRAFVRVGALTTALVIRGSEGRSWRGLMQVWRGVQMEHDPGFRHVWAMNKQIEAAPVLRLGGS